MQKESDSIDAWISALGTFLSECSSDGVATEIARNKINAIEHGFLAEDEIAILSYSDGSLWLNVLNNRDPEKDACHRALDLPLGVRVVVKFCMLDLVSSVHGKTICTLEDIAMKHGRVPV